MGVTENQFTCETFVICITLCSLMGTLLHFASSCLGLMKPGLGQGVMFLDKTFYIQCPASPKCINGYQLGVAL